MTNKQTRGKTIGGYFCSEYVSNPIGLLCAEIVVHAVADWRFLVTKRAWNEEKPAKNCNFDEIRIFFKSEWCEFLMQEFDITPAGILEMLEAELLAAMQKEK